MKSGALETTQSYLFEPFNERDTPERQLLLAILERAILDYVGNDKREASEANEWIFGEKLVSNTDGEEGESISNAEPFSFAWVCKELDLDAASVSRMVEAMPKRGTSRVAPWYFSKQTGNGPVAGPITGIAA